MRVILKKHVFKDKSETNCANFTKLIGEKGMLESTGKGQIGDTGKAGVTYTLKPFDPSFSNVDILVAFLKCNGNVVEIKSAHGNSFTFELLQ